MRFLLLPACLGLFMVSSVTGCARVSPDDATAKQLFRDKQVLELVLAAERGNVAKIDRLISEGVDVNAQGRSGATPLRRALVARNEKGYLALLQHGADPDMQDDRGDTITHVAAKAEGTFWLQTALEYNANAEAVNTGHPHAPNNTPIYYAIYKERTANVQVLIDAGANLNHVDGHGYTPLLCATEGCDYDIVYALLQGGADYRKETKQRPNIIDFHFRGRTEDLAHPDQREWFPQGRTVFEDEGVDLSEREHTE